MIHLEVIVDDTATLLDAQAYGAGALLRWEFGAAITGPFVEGGTVALVAGQSVYDVWHAAGTEATWYRTRISDSGATTFSAYVDPPFLPGTLATYLSPTQYRELSPTQLSDEGLLILLQAAQEAIVEVLGPDGARTDSLHAHRASRWLELSRPALSVTEVTQRDVTLAADDYALGASGSVLHRLTSGTNPGRYWSGDVVVEFIPRADLATRQRVQRALVDLDLSFQPGIVAEQIGAWRVQSRTDAAYQDQRAEILASLAGQEILIR